MSQIDSTDLILEARRRRLSERERRQLEDLLLMDLDARLIQLMQPELERVSQVKRGDDDLCARIAEFAVSSAAQTNAELRPGGRLTFGSKFRWIRGPYWLLAAAILFGATGAAAWWTTQPAAPIAVRGKPNVEETGVGYRHRDKSRKLAAPSPELPSTSPAVEGSARATGEPEITLVVAASPEPEARKPRDGGRANTGMPARADLLFAQANRLRREGHASEALELYRELVAEYPASQQAALSRLVLAKAAMVREPRQALALYREVARTTGSLRAEALWGIVESSTVLNQPVLKQQALDDLLREFPDSAYAAVARQGLQNATE